VDWGKLNSKYSLIVFVFVYNSLSSIFFKFWVPVKVVTVVISILLFKYILLYITTCKVFLLYILLLAYYY